MVSQKTAIGTVLIIAGVLGLIGELLAPFILVTGCFGENKILQFLQYCLYPIIIFLGMQMRKNKVVT